MFGKIAQFLTGGALLAALLNSQSAIACQPPPIVVLNMVSAEEYRFPLRQPSSTSAPPCYYPQPVWPFVFGSMTDEEVAQYVVPGSAAPAWDANKTYVAGDQVFYGGKTYMARGWNQGEAPGSASGVWQEQAASGGNPASWSASTAYPAGSRVSYGMNVYVAKWWTQGETPGTEWGAWKLDGPMQGRLPPSYSVSVNFDQTDASGNRTMKVSWTTAAFTTDAYARADNWKIRINGKVVKQGTDMQTVVGDCPPDTPACQATYRQSGSVVIPYGDKDQVTFWLCASASCRPTPRAVWISGPVFNPPLPQP